MRILVFDDNEKDCKLITRALDKISVEVVWVTALVDFSMEIAKQDFDLCILDQNLSATYTGLDIYRSHKTKVEIPFILITGERKVNLIEEAFTEGFVDYIAKPFSIVELQSRVKSSIEKADFKRKRESLFENLNDQVRIARGLINEIFPQKLSVKKDVLVSWDTTTKYELGGDFVTYQFFGEDKLAFTIGDVSGHDIRSSLVVTSFISIMNKIINDNPNVNITELSNELNQSLSGSILKDDYICCIVGIYDLNTGVASIQNLGLKDPYVYNRVTEKLEKKSCSGDLPIGWKDGEYTVKSSLNIKLGENENLLAFTDGFYEKNGSNEGLSTKEIEKSVSHFHKVGQSLFLPQMMIEEYTGVESNHHDDSTFLSLMPLNQKEQIYHEFPLGMTALTDICKKTYQTVFEMTSSENLSCKAELVIDEVVTNVFRHSEVSGVEGEILGLYFDYADELNIQIITPKGKELFKINDREDSLPPPGSEGGFGIPIIKRLTKSITDQIIGAHHVTTICL